MDEGRSRTRRLLFQTPPRPVPSLEGPSASTAAAVAASSTSTNPSAATSLTAAFLAEGGGASLLDSAAIQEITPEKNDQFHHLRKGAHFLDDLALEIDLGEKTEKAMDEERHRDIMESLRKKVAAIEDDDWLYAGKRIFP